MNSFWVVKSLISPMTTSTFDILMHIRHSDALPTSHQKFVLPSPSHIHLHLAHLQVAGRSIR